MVVVGASTGGLDALSRMVADLPADLPASVFVVQHLSPGHGAALAELLSARGPLRAALAVHGEAIVPGHICVAPPDNQMAVHDGYLNVTRGPKENGHRPSDAVELEEIMTKQKQWKGDAVEESPPGESEAAADRVAGRELSSQPREEPPPNPGRYQPKKSTPEADRQIEAEKQEEAVEKHAEDRANGTGTAPKNL